MILLAELITLAIDIYIWIIIAEVVLSWLLIFGVINTHKHKTLCVLFIRQQILL